jgi:beta-glucosidase
MQAMVPYHPKFLVDALEAVKHGYVTQERLDIAVMHVLELKRRLGYLSDARLRALDPGQEERAAVPSTDCDVACTPIDALSDVSEEIRQQERAESMQAAQDGLICVKNDGSVLPLEDVGTGDVVAVVGPTADSAANLLGAWSYHWQGSTEEVCLSLPFLPFWLAYSSGPPSTFVMRPN